MEESLNVVFDESKPLSKFKDLVEEESDPKEDCLENVENIIRQVKTLDHGTGVPNNPLEIVEIDNGLPSDVPWVRNHPIENIVGDRNKGVQT